MNVVVTILLGLLAVAAAFCVTRLLRGRSLSDRIVALDTLLVITVQFIAVDAAGSRRGVFLDVMVVVALLGFTGTAVVARFIERRGAR